MKKMKLYANSFTDEKNTAHRLEYFLLIRSAEQGKIYGIEITKTDAAGNMEKTRWKVCVKAGMKQKAFCSDWQRDWHFLLHWRHYAMIIFPKGNLERSLKWCRRHPDRTTVSFLKRYGFIFL